MAYDPNFPFGYTPYYQQQKQQSNIYAFVNGIEGAKSYPIPANQSMLLMDSEQSVCYLKQVNALGQASLKCFKLVEVKEADLKETVGNSNQESQISLAKNKEFVTLKKRVEELEKKLGDKDE